MNKSYSENDFAKILHGRRSIRQYDPNVKISREEMKQILTDVTKAPSSINMQPWRFVVVDTEEGKKTLEPLIRFNNRQNDSSAAMIVILGDLQNFDNAEKIYQTAVEKGLMPQEVKDRQLAMFKPAYEQMSREEMIHTVLIDGSLAAMQLMLVARAYGYDTNPIGGFERDKIVKALDLDENRYVPVMIVSIGKAAEEGYESVRLPIDDITFFR